jgi:hypothetical protein
MDSFPCPHCGYRQLAPPKRAGKPVVCPKCRKKSTAPKGTPGGAVSTKKAAAEDSADVVDLETAPPTPPPVVTPQPLVSVPDAEGAPAVRSEDLFAQLSTALTMKMNPAPDPRVDLRLSTGLWLVTTAVGVGMWVYFSLHKTDRLTLIWFVAGLQIVLGLGLIVYRAGCRGPVAGLVALFPPVTAYRLFQPDGPDGYRPLRFVVTAAVLAVLPFAPLPTRAAVGNTLGLTDPTQVSNPATETVVARFKRIVEKPGATNELRTELQRLAAVGPESAPEAEITQLVDMFRGLLKTGPAGIHAAAARALVAWDKDAARPDVTALLQSLFQDDRKTALSLLPTWPDEQSVRAAIDRIAQEEDQVNAKDALKAIGLVQPAVVERVTLDTLLAGNRDTALDKSLLDVLEAVGREASVAGLTRYIESTTETILKDRATTTRAAIEARLKKKSGG